MPSPKAQAIALREERATLITTARSITETAENEKRDFTTEENTRYEALWNDINSLGSRAERLDKEARALAESSELEGRGAPGAGAPGGENAKLSTFENIKRADVRENFERIARANATDFRFSEDYRAAFRDYCRTGENRALSAGSDPDGGFTVPAAVLAGFMEKVRDSVFIESFATTDMLTTGDSLGRVTLETRPDDADWTSEIATGSEDGSTAFGQRDLSPHPLAKRVKISRKLIRASGIGVEGVMSDNLAYKFAITREKAFMTGTGAGQPLGIFTASTDGISTARDMATGNTTTAITFDGLKNAKWNLKAGYLAGARWVFHRDAMAMIDKLKGSDLNYILQPDVRGGTGDVLLGNPVSITEYAPNTFTTGNYVGMIADFSYYWIVDSLGFTLQRLAELYAETNQIGFIGRAETDAMPIFEEAFSRVTLA